MSNEPSRLDIFHFELLNQFPSLDFPFNQSIDMAKGGVTKKGKDPNAPKRAMSAFFLWMQENRARLKVGALDLILNNRFLEAGNERC
jgi:hypothetical protein